MERIDLLLVVATALPRVTAGGWAPFVRRTFLSGILSKLQEVADPGGGGAGTPPPPRAGKKKIGPGIRQVRPPQHDVWGALECTAAPVSVHKDIHLDFEEVVTTYGHKHPRRMLLARPLDAWFSSCWTSFFWSSQWLQIFCKNCKYMYKLPCKFALWFFWNCTPK